MPELEPSPSFFAPTSRGTEEVLAAKYARSVTLASDYRACLDSRAASRVLMPLARFESTDGETLYDSDIPESNLSVDWYDGKVASRSMTAHARSSREWTPVDFGRRLRLQVLELRPKRANGARSTERA